MQPWLCCHAAVLWLQPYAVVLLGLLLHSAVPDESPYHLLVLLVCTRPVLQVLVHAGTGGVGLAAIQVARALGCQVLASAGSPAKRSSLRRLGVAATADSRSTAFAESIAVAIEGAGVDFVLNSLTSPGE
jgi:NADPH:quinone reductase-like Zn-dependent oxidoreductase